ncbi:hypothetical protein GJ688_05045 [Heliobacillus mobilis]|uniref:Uncharacterized protein n=1 Tax=Heliobacterium mobile TaxID=28064 RepID=A0A6I3SHN9_HELMO|nr:hypothetical protein [Heliobacterium mobile]
MWGRHQSQGKEQGPRMMGTHIKDILSSLVTAGTISQAQSDLISTALPQPPQNSLNQLVTNGTVTQDQLNAILQALHGGQFFSIIVYGVSVTINHSWLESITG